MSMLGIEFPAVMGILNVTPDSFSDGGLYHESGAALDHARQMIADGADIIDVGGESTRPGSGSVTVREELERVIPVIEALRRESAIPISVDTSTPEVITEAARAGAGLINDVRALRRSGALEAAVETSLPVCLMHMKGEPDTMQADPRYDDLIGEISTFFTESMERCEAAGISRDRIILDPGFGFGKTPEHNLTLLNRLDDFLDLGRPLMMGLSRKSTIGKVLDAETEDRLIGSIAGAVIAIERGASIIRAHDVAETVQAVRMTTAILEEKS
jgi:dihydropteroate synthase